MPKKKLTDRFVATAPTVGNSQTEYFDEVTTGLSLRVSPGTPKKGETRTFFLNYTRPDGRRARLKLGRYPDLNLAAARERARAGREQIADGTDPEAERKRARLEAAAASMTVHNLVESYLTRHAAKNRSAAEIARRLRYNVTGMDAEGCPLDNRSKGTIGGLKLAELHKRDITRTLDAIIDRGAVVEANRVHEDLRALLNWARGRGDIEPDLMAGMRKPTETRPRSRVLSTQEIMIVWENLPKAAMFESTRRVVRLLIILGQRVSEICEMKREELDLDRAEWNLPAERSKNGRPHRIPLPAMAIEILREQIEEADALAVRKGRKPSEFVFPGPGARAPLGGAAVAKAIKKQEEENLFSIEAFTPHDLRRTFATGLQEIGFSPYIVAHLLNHQSGKAASITTSTYALHHHWPEKREAMDAWAARLQGIIAGGAEVIPLRRGGAR